VKRICLVGAAMAALLTAGIATASASATPAAKKPVSVNKKPVTKLKPVKTALTCSLKLVTQIPANDVTITQGAESGTQYGRAGCGKPPFSGVEQSSLLQDQSGNLSGRYQQWFNAGSLYGDYKLTPQDTGPPTSTTFTNASYTGTVTVTNGTGIYRKAAGTGTLTCTTTDLAHYACTEKLKLVQPVLMVVTPKK
jgi:hypothetical protein